MSHRNSGGRGRFLVRIPAQTATHDQRAIPPYKIMTNDCQPYLPLGDVVLPQPDPTPQLVEEVMNRFDFQRVQTAMRALGWTYFSETESPSLETLRATARHLLESVAHVEGCLRGAPNRWLPRLLVSRRHSRADLRGGVRIP